MAPTLRALNDRGLTRHIHLGVTTIILEVDTVDIELPRMFGGGSSEFPNISLWDYICWLHNTYLRLTHFSLYRQLATATLDEFLRMLEALPYLEVLHLE